MVKCWAQEYCTKKSDENCHDFCTGFVLLSTLYYQCGMPKIYQYKKKMLVEKADEKVYTAIKAYINNIEENVQQGSGLFLYGNTGTGKTALACMAMNYYFRKMAFRSNADCLGVFLHVPTFLEDYRKSYGNNDYKFEELLDNLLTADMVIFDDIGSEKPSEWVRERLLTIIDSRVGDGLCNIFTSNLTLKRLESTELLGSRIASRILGCTNQYEFKGADKRRVGEHQ